MIELLSTLLEFTIFFNKPPAKFLYFISSPISATKSLLAILSFSFASVSLVYIPDFFICYCLWLSKLIRSSSSFDKSFSLLLFFKLFCDICWSNDFFTAVRYGILVLQGAYIWRILFKVVEIEKMLPEETKRSS